MKLKRIYENADPNPDLDRAIRDMEFVLGAAPPQSPCRMGMDDELRKVKKARAGVAWYFEALRAYHALETGSYPTAREKYEKAIQEAGRSAEADPEWRSDVGLAHYNLACVCGVLSTGRTTPNGEARAIAPGTASELRKCAFDNLAKAIELGGVDRAFMENDRDLESLHDDPRWAELLKGLPK